jgi:two-component system cell cycle response regulator
MSARILVVDDILPNVKLLEAKLNNEYYEVFTATSGEEALAKAASERPDLILLDIMMPGMDGYEVCRRLKANKELAHIPVVMVTALTDPEDKVRGLEVGADDFLSKPINDTALMARVKSLVRLKMTMDEWHVRENAATQLGIVESFSAMAQSDRNGKILIIEDRDFEQKKFTETLQGEHDMVMCVSSGPRAVELVGKYSFDVIILSLNLNGEDGLRLVSHLKSNEHTRSVPIVMVGKEEDMPKIANGLEFGAHDYLIRPVERNELKARIRTQIRKKRFQESLRSSYEISLSMALTDGLTGLYNRRYLEVHLDKLLQKNREDKKRLAVLLMDIDHFKKVNDTYGHGVGDEILKSFAARLRDKLRSFDAVARYGGEEFVVILPDVSTERAYRVADRLRSTIANEPFACKTPQGLLDITTSIGGAIISDDETVSVREALDRADKCLYEAKESGRNCVVFEGKGVLDPDEVAKLEPQKPDMIEDKD